MAEPARKLEDIEPDIRPQLRVISGGNQPGLHRRPDLREINNQETNPDTGHNDDSINDQEAAGSNITSGSWENKVEGDQAGDSKAKGRFSFLKKKGPLATIIILVFGGGIGITTLLSPSLLFINLKEVMVNKFNLSQLTSLDTRTNLILGKKTSITDLTSGLCGDKVTFACRYTTMSKKQVSKLEAAGITVNHGEVSVTTEKTVVNADGTKHTTTVTENKPYNSSITLGTVESGDSKITTELLKDSTSLTGRIVPTSLSVEGSEIKPNQLTKTLSENAEVRSAFQKAYNPKFASLADSINQKILSLLGLNKKAVSLKGDTDAEKMKDVQDEAIKPKESVDKSSSGLYKDEDGTIKDQNGEVIVDKDGKVVGGGGKYTAEEINTAKNLSKEAASAAATAANDLADSAANTAKTGEKAATEAIDSLESGSKAVVSGVLGKGSDIIGNACTAYNTIRAIGFGAKVVRATQLAGYAMLFLKIADQIKAGDSPNPADVAVLGTILTTEYASTKKTATDSYGYNYAAYGTTGALSTTAMQYLVGGGLTGQLINATSELNKTLGGNAESVCAFTNSKAGQALQTVVGIASLFNPITLSVRLVAGVLSTAVISSLPTILPALLNDIVAGVAVDSNTVGEASGDAITSGASYLMGSTAAAGGNAALTPTQAADYANLSNKVAQKYAEQDQLAYSPLDITNSNTLVGSIYTKILPYLSKMSSLSGIISSLASVTTDSIASLSPVTKAATTEDYQLCQDEDYKKMGLATDPYCNVVYGIPTQYLNEDPLEVAQNLYNNGQIDIDGKALAKGQATDKGGTSTGIYQSYIDNCFNRNLTAAPLGYTGDSNQYVDGSQCKINDSNKDYFLYYVDQRALNGMEGDDSTLEAASSYDQQKNISFYDSNTNPQNNVASSQKNNNSLTSVLSKITTLGSESVGSTVNTVKLLDNSNVYSLSSNDNNLFNYSSLGYTKGQGSNK
jgi:hypothetical protein